jgi:hypothetical protein
LQTDPGAKRIAANPALLGGRVHALQIIERAGGVGEFAHAVVEHALRTPDAAKVEAQHTEAFAGEELVELHCHAILH